MSRFVKESGLLLIPRKELIHPQVGYMALEYNTFQVNELPDLKVVVYLPASEETASKLKQLLGHEAVQV